MAGAAASEALGLAALGLAAAKDYDSSNGALAVAASIAGALVLSAVLKAVSDAQMAVGQIKLENLLRNEMADSILAADWQEFVDQPGHELQSAVISEAPQVSQATFAFIRGRGAMCGAVVVFASTLFVSWVATAICAGFGAVIVFIYSRSSRSLGEVQRELADGNTRLTRETSILISGLRSLRLSPIQGTWRKDLQSVFDRLASARRHDLLIPVRGRLLVEALAGVMIFVVLLAQVAFSGKLLPGLIVMALILRVMPRVQAAQQQLHFSRHGTVWVERWNERIAKLQVVGDVRSPQGSSVMRTERSALRLENVCFSFRRHDRPVLRDVNLELLSGEWVSLRGVSGGGKSTLIDVIGGILVPTSGAVLLGERPISHYEPSARYSMLSIVPQDVHLLGQNSAEIVSWGGRLPNQDAEVSAISASLGVDEMFLFGDQLSEERIDEMGRDISGGMRTRLAMARALVTNPSILILDETTSRLHPSAEAEIFAELRKLRPDLAVLVVTHRQETTALVDRQLELVDGGVRIV